MWQALNLVFMRGKARLGSFALTRVLARVLFKVEPTDPLTFVTVTFSLCVVALLACNIPARRATKVDPMVALRFE